MDAGAELEGVGDPRRAATLLHPLRLRLMALARGAASATELARRLRLPRQRVNYHVRALYRAGFLRKAGRRRKRNMIEQRFVASARAYVLLPGLLGPMAARSESVADTASAAHLLALSAQAQAEVARALRESAAQGKRLATLSLSVSLRFESPDQREAFARALTESVASVAVHHSSPDRVADGRPGPGRPFRLVIGCYPIPPSEEGTEAAKEG